MARPLACALALLAAPGMAWAAGPASQALCAATQQVAFHCSLGAKSVSLCIDGSDTQIDALEYRYGTPRRIELRWQASAGNGRRFTAATAALDSGARVRQLWFDNAGLRYLVSQCVGGNCPAAAGLAVLRGDALLMRRSCQTTADDRAWFSPKLGRFGADAASSQSATPLLQFDDVDNGVERLYSAPGR